MKRLIGFLAVLSVVFLSGSVFAQEKVYKIDDTGPAGGLIFYVDPADAKLLPEGITYLEAAPRDQSTNIQWSNWGSLAGDVRTGATGTDIGTGQANTTAIVKKHAIVKKQGAGSYAAKLCDDLVVGGKSDWFLPSLDELGEMYYGNRRAYNCVAGFTNDSYWSSSEIDAVYAWYVPGVDPIHTKGSSHHVRCARDF